MNETMKSNPAWRLPTLLLWLILIFTGAFPVVTFSLLRELGHVTTQRALINSPYMVMIGWSAFLGYFAHARCRAAGLDQQKSLGRTLELIVVGLVAFVPFPWQILGAFERIPKLELQVVVLIVGAAKVIALISLVLLVVRYYYGAGDAVFTRLLPRHREQEADEQMPPRPDGDR